MSVKQMGLVWELNLPHNEAWVLMAYADHADDEGGHVFPSIGKIAWKTGYKERQVQNIVRSLESKGLLQLVTHRIGGRGILPLYQLTLEKGAKKTPFQKGAISERVQATTETADKRVQSTTERVQSTTSKSQQNSTESNTYASQPSVEPSVKREPSVARAREDARRPENVDQPQPAKPKPEKPKRRDSLSHFFPEDFPTQPPPEFLSWVGEHCPGVDVAQQWPMMLDHEFTQPHSDWWKVARNWMRKAPQYHPTTNGHEPPRPAGRCVGYPRKGQKPIYCDACHYSHFAPGG